VCGQSLGLFHCVRVLLHETTARRGPFPAHQALRQGAIYGKLTKRDAIRLLSRQRGEHALA